MKNIENEVVIKKKDFYRQRRIGWPSSMRKQIKQREKIILGKLGVFILAGK